MLVVADRRDPGPADRYPASTEGHRAVLATVALGRPSRVVLALGPCEVGDLGLHQLGHHLQTDRGRGGQQPLAHVLHEPGQMPVQAASQPLGQPKRRRGHQAQPITISGLGGRNGRVRVLHPGSSSSDLAVLGAWHVHAPGADPT
jgi:hypothetical protein